MENPRRLATLLSGVDDPMILLKGLFDHAPTAFLVYQTDGTCLLANRACADLFGGEPPPGYNIFKDEHAEAQGVAHLIRRAFEGETVHLPAAWYDRRDLKHVRVLEGRRVAVQVTLFPVRDRTGAVQYVALCAKDTTAEHLLREANDALRRSEREIAATLQSIGDGVIATDASGHVTRMNPAAERLTGWKLEAARGRPLEQIFRVLDEETRRPLESPAVRVMEKGVAAGLETPAVLITRDGAERAIADTCAPIPASDGSVQGVVVVFRDVSDKRRVELLRRKHEQELRRSEETLRSALIASRSLAWTLDLRTGKIQLSENSRDILGLEPEQSVETLAAMVHPGDLEDVFASLGALNDGQPPRDQPFRFFRADTGELVCVESRARPIRDAEGRVLGATGQLVDVTDRWRAQEALRISEARYRTQFEAAPEAIVSIDIQTGLLVEANGNAASLFGRPREELLRMSIHDLVPPMEPDGRRTFENLQALWRRAASGEQVTFEWTIRNRDQQEIPCELRAVRLPAADRSLCRLSIVDISDRRRAEELRARGAELELWNHRIQEASRLKSEFLANMSHELRTPLNAIIGFAELLYDGHVDQGSPEYKEFLGDVLTSGRHLLHLINDILDVAKIEAGKIELRPEPVSLSELVEGVCATLRSLSAKKNVHVLADLDGSLQDISIDAGRFRQILYNYLSNAIKFTPEGGRVIVRTRAEGPDTFRIEVEDNGVGIAPEDMGRLFMEFEQLESGAAKKHGGTGLGLALTQRVVKALGGSVGLQSKVGVGSTFYAVLPRKPRAAA